MHIDRKEMLCHNPILAAKYRHGIGIAIRIGIRFCECKWATTGLSENYETPLKIILKGSSKLFGMNICKKCHLYFNVQKYNSNFLRSHYSMGITVQFQCPDGGRTLSKINPTYRNYWNIEFSEIHCTGNCLSRLGFPEEVATLCNCYVYLLLIFWHSHCLSLCSKI